MRRNTPRPVKKSSPKSWSLVEASFVRAVTELVLEPGLETTCEAIRSPTVHEVKHPGGYLTDIATMDNEFPLQLAAELLVQRGATEQWFTHQWTIGFARAYLSDWGIRNYHKRPDSRIADVHRRIFSPTSQERENPFFTRSTISTSQEESLIHRPLTDNLLDLVPNSPTTHHIKDIDGSEANAEPEYMDDNIPAVSRVPYYSEEVDGFEVNMDAEDPYERQIY
jgi:hypothetical protein